MRYPAFCLALSLVFMSLVLEAAWAGIPHQRMLIGPGAMPDLAKAKKNDADVLLSDTNTQPVLVFKMGHKDRWPGVTFLAPQQVWDLATFAQVEAEVHNRGAAEVRIGCRLDGPDSDKKNPPAQGIHDFSPGEKAVIRVPLRRKMPPELAGRLFGMRGYPGGLVAEGGLDPAHVTQVRIFAADPKADSEVAVLSIRAVGSSSNAMPIDPAKLFPMIDSLGQYKHADWPGKTRSAGSLTTHARTEEVTDLQSHPGPKDWDLYGGWRAGPALEATGFFHAVKHAGKWWLVDPEGRLFWSHGIDCVRGSSATPITDRKHWFEELPQAGSPLARFLGKGSWAPHNYYEGKTYETFDFYGANLWRKFGDDWPEQFAAQVHQRLRSWGMNTIANWSDERVYLARKTPYTVTIHHEFKKVAGSTGYWGQFADVFDPSFREGLRKGMAREKGRSAGDPWCLGYFIDNELGWGDEVSLAIASLASPPEQPAKIAFLESLKAKYPAIEGLNHAWGTSHASWQALLESRQTPDVKNPKTRDDLAAFYTRFAEEYFRQCREAVKEVAPKTLYLGCRFAWVNDRAVLASAKYCDVISYNLYRDQVKDFRLPAGIDLPVVIGEFHFGALDRGMFHTGLRPVENQLARGQAYARYVRGAIENPCLVGSHWFQYVDQATTGRGDGENYQIGFIDICDRPYPETIQACREVGDSLYATRLAR